ncbi:transcription factor tfiiic complex subunit sfc9 [Schizosaccharomyces japonicus yFS275]|uniref:Transcription factor tfiiic complex subunit sfc9 n=1 Tax=Schizosaccharomyces japonicus (strain yFS275 / FY16936) TaxID=402676 RepID=B6K4I5_SCHJY|nr:transcription factor tfiiic complex subunit sfc9 [Schizosaccharomyces japonicus yFS275]EEB08392.1 transcription factor tfiiic complex subunit sfc9 [Schizosaccharomyces japonicus yFS275]
MVKDVTLDFVPSNYCSCSWSTDGKIALCSGDKVQVLIPDVSVSGATFVKAHAALNQDDSLSLVHLSPVDLRVGDLLGSVVCKALAWSPMGLSDNYGRRLHSLAWSPAAHLPEFDPWGVSIFAVGNENGQVLLAEMFHGTAPSFKTINLSCSWIKRLAFSSWYPKGNSTYCLLVCASALGGLYILQVVIDGITHKISVTVQTILQQERSYSTLAPSLTWTPIVDGCQYLVVIQSNRCFYVCHKPTTNQLFPVVEKSLKFCSRIAGVSVHLSAANELIIFVLSSDGECEVISLNSETISQSVLEDLSVLMKFFASKLRCYGEHEEDNRDVFMAYGFAPSPHASFAAVHFGIALPHELRYTINAYERSYLTVSTPCSNKKQILKRILKDALDSFIIWPSEGILWELATLQATTKRQPDVVNLLHESVKPLVPTDLSATFTLPPGNAGVLIITNSFSNLSWNAMRLLYGWSVYFDKEPSAEMRTMLRFTLIFTVLQYVIYEVSKSPLFLTSNCRKILKCYLADGYKEYGDKDAAVKLFSKVEKILSSSENHNEYCPACNSIIEFQDPVNATCSKGHVWRRCALTFLPLSGIDTRYCGVCRSAYSGMSIMPEEHCLTGFLLTKFSLCYYCGGRLLGE